jgi:hypothetical protein
MPARRGAPTLVDGGGGAYRLRMRCSSSGSRSPAIEAQTLVRPWASVVVAGFFAACAGCQPPRAAMVEIRRPVAIAADPGAATVVFVRRYEGPLLHDFAVADATAHRVLGVCESKSSFEARVEPGTRTFVAWGAGDEGAIVTRTEAGRVYFVEVTYDAIRGLRLSALDPHRGDVRAALDGTRALAPVRAAIASEFTQREVDDAIARALRRWGDYPPEERSAQVVTPEQGVNEPLRVAPSLVAAGSEDE